MPQLLVHFRRANDQQAEQVDKEFELAASELVKDYDAAIHLGKVNLADHKKAAKLAGIDVNGDDGSRVVCFRRGKKLPLGPNGYDARSLVNFVRYLTGEVSKKLGGPAAVSEWLKYWRTVRLPLNGPDHRPFDHDFIWGRYRPVASGLWSIG